MLEARLRYHLQFFLAQRRPIALRVLEQLVGFRDPQRLAAAFEPIVQDHAGNLAALSGAGAVARKKPRRKRTVFSASSGATETKSNDLNQRKGTTRRDVPHGLRRHRSTLSSWASDKSPNSITAFGRCDR